jgi:UDP-N-acetylmuramate dehydrogenase
MQFLEQVPLAPYTTFQIGGPARWFAEAASEDDIAAGIAFAAEPPAVFRSGRLLR